MNTNPMHLAGVRAFFRRWQTASIISQSTEADAPADHPAHGDEHPDTATRIVRRCKKCWGSGYRTVKNLACEEVTVECIDCDGTGREAERIHRKAFGS